MGFWGPKMTEVIEHTTKLGIPLNVSPPRFAQMVDELTGLHHPENIRIEECAEFWLPRLRELTTPSVR